MILPLIVRRTGAVSADQAPGMGLAQERPQALGAHAQGLDPVPGKIAARQRHCLGPAGSRHEVTGNLVERRLGQPTVGGDLSAVDREQWRLPIGGVEREHVVARCILCLGGAVIIERPHARKGVHHALGHQRFAQILVRRSAQISDLLRRCGGAAGFALEIQVGRADQREVAHIWNGENDAPIGALQDIGPVVVEQTADHDVAALDEPHTDRRRAPQQSFGDLSDPWAGCVDESTGR